VRLRLWIKLGGPWAFVGGDLLGAFDGAAVFEIGGDAGCPKSVAEDCFWQACGPGTPLGHPDGVVAVHRPGGERSVAVDGAEGGPFFSQAMPAGADLPGARVRAITTCSGLDPPDEVVRRLTQDRDRPMSGSMSLVRLVCPRSSAANGPARILPAYIGRT